MKIRLSSPPPAHKIGNVYESVGHGLHMIVQVGVQTVALVQLTGRGIDDSSIGNRWRDGKRVSNALDITEDELDSIGGDSLGLKFVGRLEIA